MFFLAYAIFSQKETRILSNLLQSKTSLKPKMAFSVGRSFYRRCSSSQFDRLVAKNIRSRVFGSEANRTDLPPTAHVISMYDAPLAASITSLKRVSFTTALLSLAIPPSVIFMGPEHIPIAGQAAVRLQMRATIFSLSIHKLIKFLINRLQW